MPEFHFSINDGSPLAKPATVNLPDLATAKSEAIIMAGQMLKDADGKFWENSHWQIDITAADGLVLASIHIDGFTAPAGE